MARILVTGASGFLGRFLPSELLARGHLVHLAGRNLENTVWPLPLDASCVLHNVDLLESGAARSLIAEVRPTHLLHLAWYAEPGLFWSSPRNLDWVAASLQLYQAFADVGGKRFVGAGTCAEYDWSHDVLSPDSTPLNPSTLYGRAKAALFQMLSDASQTNGISFAWGRIFYPFGPFERPERLLPTVINKLLRDEPVNLSEGSQIRDFIYSEDAARMFADLIDSPFEGPVNIASGAGLSIRKFLEIVLRHLGDANLLRFGNVPPGADATPRMIADITNIPEISRRIPLIGVEEGVARTVSWWSSR
ncbi:MAG TPA: NAD(P)-dependent oxidoreductase [Rhizomicrobium sp.]|jgi:nucleoside-diphosphate-sugar epimerase|nr:NAD(P)-dependent oxidoreductase [Rhizomicrobium sp.]